MIEYSLGDDLALAKELLGMTYAEIADAIGIDQVTLSRWKSGQNKPSDKNISRLYDFMFKKGLRINKIKAQLHKEQLDPQGGVLLFHGAKTSVEGKLSLAQSRPDNDFGHGFYCGETLEQSAMFVSGYPRSSIYIFEFDTKGLKSLTYHVDRDWMLTIAWFRGKLREYSDSPLVKQLIRKLDGADYIVAPIADNRMFEILNNFIDGEITDVQCQHCLSATNLGNQYVMLTEKALRQTHARERCFLSEAEKAHYENERKDEAAVGADKVKAARRQFRGQGQYIDEVLS